MKSVQRDMFNMVYTKIAKMYNTVRKLFISVFFFLIFPFCYKTLPVHRCSPYNQNGIDSCDLCLCWLETMFLIEFKMRISAMRDGAFYFSITYSVLCWVRWSKHQHLYMTYRGIWMSQACANIVLGTLTGIHVSFFFLHDKNGNHTHVVMALWDIMQFQLHSPGFCM